MLHELLKTFFIGQIILEKATLAAKEQIAAARENAAKLKVQAEEYKKEKLLSKAGDRLKKQVISLRNANTRVNQACDAVSKLLVETYPSTEVSVVS